MLFYRFVSVLGDPDSETQKLASTCFVNLLKNKQPIMFFSHFVETIFYLNDNQDHPVYNQVAQTTQERQWFTMPGPNNLQYVSTLPCLAFKTC
jgi:condensin-2 complex subunit D3